MGHAIRFEHISILFSNHDLRFLMPQYISNQKFLGYIGAAVIIFMIAADRIRLNIPGQHVYISLFPLFISILGVYYSYSISRLSPLPKTISFASQAILILCIYGSLIGYINGLDYKQIIAGWIAYAGPIPAILLGHTIGKSEIASVKFIRWSIFCLIFSILVAIMQQFGLFEIKQYAIEGASTTRAIKGLGNFEYISGPFRTASVFSMFLACSTAILIFSDIFKNRKKVNILIILISVLASIASLFAARRSGSLMLLGTLLPFFFLQSTRTWFKIALLVFSFLFLIGPFFYNYSTDPLKQIELKLAHSVTQTGFSDRVGDVFKVNSSDLNLLSITGDGLGSYGAAVRAAGLSAAAKADIRLNKHPILHFGWFKDLAMLGPIGLFLHLVFFYYIGKSVTPSFFLRKLKKIPMRWSGFGLCLSSAIVYFFIATSWLQGITGGVVFGIAVGFISGRLDLAHYILKKS